MNRSMEYGLNAAGTVHEELNSIIEDFAQGHAAMQNTIQNLTQDFPVVRMYRWHTHSKAL